MTHHPHVQGHESGRTIALWAVLITALAASILTTNLVPMPLLSAPTAAIAIICAVFLVRAHRRRKRAASGTTSKTTPSTASEH
jgi:Flp pilus assembly protein TadB